MAKRQCEVEDRGNLDGNVNSFDFGAELVLMGWNIEITNAAGTKRRRTTPKEEKENILKAPVAAEKGKGKEEKDLKGRTTVLKEAKATTAGAIATSKEDVACVEPVATQEDPEAPVSKEPDAEKAQNGREKDADAVSPKDEKIAKVVVPTPVNSSKVAAQKEGPTKAPVATENSKKRTPKARAAAPKKTELAPKAAAKKPPRARAAGPLQTQVIELESLCKAIMDLPHDVIYTILGYLHPLYLVELRGANRLLKDLLDSPTPWKAARKITYDAPDPPEGVPEWRWATVLWGNKCDLCGGVSDRLQEGIDFYVLRRHCDDCKWRDRRRIVVFRNTEIDEVYPAQPKELFEYVFYTPVRSLSAATKASTQLRYWHRDVLAVIATWNEFQKALTNKDGAAEFEEWKEARRKAITLRVEMGDAYEAWKETVVESDQEARTHDLKLRLRDLGFKQVDIDAAITVQSLSRIKHVFHIKDTPPVSASEWKKFQPALVTLAGDEQARRLRPYLKGELSKRYLEHVLTLPPCDWRMYPPLEALADSVTLAYLLPDDPLLKPSIQDLSPFLRSLKQPRDRYWARKEVEVKERVMNIGPGSRGFKAAHDLAKYVCVCNDLPTETASSPTGRRNVTLCIGWSSIGRHACLEDWDELSTLKPPGLHREFRRHELRHDPVLSEHAYRLILKAGKDPQKATAAEMDKLDPYYLCESQDQSARWVFSWRGALYHLLRDRNAMFTIVPDELAAKAKAAAAMVRDMAPVWSCNRCSDDGDLKTETKLGILQHIQSAHRITDPKSDKDYFLNQDLLHLCEVGFRVVPRPSRGGEATEG